MLLIDDSGTLRSGKKSSVGVSILHDSTVVRYEDRESQVIVFATLVKGSSYAMVNTQLYLQVAWSDDKERKEEVCMLDNIYN